MTADNPGQWSLRRRITNCANQLAAAIEAAEAAGMPDEDIADLLAVTRYRAIYMSQGEAARPHP